MVSLGVELDRVDKQVNFALSLLATLPTLKGLSRHYIAELTIVRIFARFRVGRGGIGLSAGVWGHLQ